MSLKFKLPLFISFEGGEGAGKTSLINALATALAEQGYDVILTRQPGGTHLGEAVRDLLLHSSKGSISPKAELFLFLAARTQSVEEIILPALKEDKIVLCDRFHDSTIAYQGYAQNLGEEEIEALSHYSADGIVPDLTIYLDIDPATGLERAKTASRGKVDRIEAQKLAFHDKVRVAFLRIAEKDPKRFKVIDAHLTQPQVLEKTVSLLEQYCRN